MSDYVKQEWIDNETLINAERLNHIEDGIAAAGGEAPIEHITVNKVEQPIVDKTVDLDIDRAYVEETTLIIGDDASGGGTIECIKVNGTALAIENSTVDISVPTKTSELTNDAKFITDAAVETVKETADTALETAQSVADTAITGITVNGTAATVNDHVAEITVSGESAIERIQVNGTDQTIKDKTVNISVPTKTSELTNDSGYLTDAVLDGYAKTSDVDAVKETADSALEKAEAAQSAIPTKVSELENDAKYATESAIPTKVSQLENDSGYATAPTVDGEMLVYGG